MAKHKLGLSLLTLLFGLAGSQQLKAVTVSTVNFGTISGPFTSSGALGNQGQVLEASFSLTSATNLTIYTTSYGGGANANGTTATAGGFMPSLVLYNSAGNYVASQLPSSPMGKMDPATGLNGDSYLTMMNLAAGNYIMALSDIFVQQPATATNLSDGFINYGGGTTFSDVQGNLRNGNYSLNITGPSAAAAPEPATFWLIVPALGAIVSVIRKRNTK
ncbi:MAG: DVUA0089 family protein [Acidobacteriaceae bacterium]|nr:DVUA0089 family protein [Acidobacteriaceae bacterium]MBV9940319.1 DVUA0089 family protein [Acidobacteriaceae bacterium]